MKKRETVDERLRRINKEFDELLSNTGISDNKVSAKTSTLEQLVRFGLTPDEAKDWLSNEPNYNRRNFTGKQNRRRLDRTQKR